MNENERQPVVAVIGGANVDYLARGPHLPRPGETIHGDTFLVGPGGKGANQAVAAARLGCPTLLVARVGADENGDLVLSRLREEGIDAQYITRDPSESTGVALIFVDGKGEKAILSVRGANDRLTTSHVRAAEAILRRARVLLLQLEVSNEVNQAAIRIAREAGIPVVLDPAPARELPDDFLAQIDLIKPNSTEAEILTGIESVDRPSAQRAAESLLTRGVKAVAVQAGDSGNLVAWQDGEIFLEELPVESVDATGAGDAFAAALAVALAEGWPMEEAGRFANAAAAFKTTGLGAQTSLPTREQVTELLERYR